MTFFMRHNLTQTCLVDLLKIVNIIVGFKSIPETHYKFMKFCSNNFQFCKQFYCGNCNLFIGILTEDLIKNFVCSNCHSANIKYFLINTIENKIRSIILKNYKSILDFKNQINTTNNVCDIMKGKFMESFESVNNFSISFNTDGVSLFKSNLQKSFWPILITLNDLPPKLRYLKKNIVVAALWCDKNISFEIFFKPLTKELVSLYEKGIDIFGTCYKIVSSAFCLDSVARCKLLKMKQFNGSFGCTYCKHPGNSVKIGG